MKGMVFCVLPAASLTLAAGERVFREGKPSLALPVTKVVREVLPLWPSRCRREGFQGGQALPGPPGDEGGQGGTPSLALPVPE
jgi:hypothetical protein